MTTMTSNKTEQIQKNLKNIRKALRLHVKALNDMMTDDEAQTLRLLARNLASQGVRFHETTWQDFVEITSEDGALVYAYFSHSRTTGEINGFRLQF